MGRSVTTARHRRSYAPIHHTSSRHKARRAFRGAHACVVGKTQCPGGINTVSIMYTCALAVGTPPHTRPALLTLSPLPLPVTFTDAPWTEGCEPSTCAGLSWPGTT